MMIRNTLKSFGLLLLLSMCEKEEEVQSREYPRVRTFPVTEITANGARFHGQVFYAPGPMLDHGFIWSTLPNLNLGNAEIHSLGSFASTGEFEARIERSLKKGITYYVRAYAKTQTHEVYGDPILFVSLGSDAPVVTGLDPAQGRTQDTIRVVGRNFSKISENITVRFDTVKSTLVAASDSLLRVIVPALLDLPSSIVHVSVLGNVGSSPMPFELIGPTIGSVSPVLVAACDTLRITGSDFSTLPGNIEVTLGGIQCPILSVTPIELAVLVPTFTPATSQVSVEVTSSNVMATYPNPITYQGPAIQAMSPVNNITYLDTLTFTGVHLPLCVPLTLTIGNLTVVPTLRTTTKVKAIVPQTLTTTTNTITLKFGNNEYVYQTSFSLADPVITSISPASATFGDVITISGDFFHPVTPNNYVNVGNSPATIISGTRTQLTARINNSSAVCSEYNSCHSVHVIVGDRVTSSNAFSLKKPVIISISPLPLGKPEAVTITGEYFSPGAYNYVNLNNHRLTAIVNSSTSITVNMTTDALANYNPFFSYSWTGSLWVSVGNADPSRPTSLYSNAVGVQVNYEGPWTQMNSFTGNYRATPMSFSINNKAYLIGGLSDTNTPSAEVWEYAAATDSWRRLSDFPGGTRLRGVGFTHHGLGYVGLGQGDTGWYSDVWEFDPGTEVWTRLADFPGGARNSPFCFTTGGYSYVGGGEGVSPAAPADFWSFDPATKTWVQKQDIPRPFYNGVAFNTNTGGYVVDVSELWKYDPAANTWTQKASPGFPNGNSYIYRATGLDDWDRGFVFSGTSNYFYMYDPYQDNWTTLISINSPGYGRTGFNIGHIYYYGLGRAGSGSFVSEFYQLEMLKYPD